MSRPPTILESHQTTGRRLRLVFEWGEDRFGHVIVIVNGEHGETLLRSIESSPAEAEPVSPPLQQLHVEDRGHGTRVALLVGMAGRGHWSLSVDAAADGQSFMFDVACRSHGNTIPLGSRYQIEPLAGSAGTTSMLDRTSDSCLDLRAGWRVRAACAERGTASVLQLDDHGLRIAPAASKSATFRWKYVVELVEPK